jgi:hypothetical protein
MSEQDFELYLKLLSRCLALTSHQREQIADELRDHLEERLDELARAGLPREKAVVQALDEFGDAAVLAAHFTTIAHLKRRRFLMRLSLGSVVALAAGLLIAFAFWPENRAVRLPAPVFADNKSKAPAPVHVPRAAARRPVGASAATSPVQEHPLSSDVGQQPRIEAALEQVTDFNIDPQPLKDAFDFIAQRYQIPMLLDRKALEDASIDTTAEVRLPYAGLKLRQVLTLLLDQLGQPMGFDIRDGVLWVSTREKVEDRRFVVVYDCRDLVNLRPIMPVEAGRRRVQGMSQPHAAGMMGGMGGGGMSGGGMFDVPPASAEKGKEAEVAAGKKAPGKSPEPAATECDEPVSPLIRVIKYAGGEAAWGSESEGGGQVTELGGLLVVNQSANVHEEIKRILSDLRHIRKDGAFANLEKEHIGASPTSSH